MPNISTTIRKIESFATLPVGWRFGKGLPVTNFNIEIGKLFLQYGFDFGIERFNAFAGDSGEVMISFYFADHNIDLTFEVNHTVTFEENIGDEQVQFLDNLNIKDAFDKICQFTQSISESSIQETTTLSKEDSRVSPSNLPHQTAASPSLKYNVVLMQAGQSANTSASSTTRSRAIRQYIGRSRRRTSQQNANIPRATARVGTSATTI